MHKTCIKKKIFTERRSTVAQKIVIRLWNILSSLQIFRTTGIEVSVSSSIFAQQNAM